MPTMWGKMVMIPPLLKGLHADTTRLDQKGEVNDPPLLSCSFTTRVCICPSLSIMSMVSFCRRKQVKGTFLSRWLLRKELHVPWKGPAELESMMKAHTTDRENTETQVFSAYISIASVKEKRARLSAQLRSLSASAAYSALPLNDNERRNKGETIKPRINYNCDKWISNGRRNFSALPTRPWEFSPLKAA